MAEYFFYGTKNGLTALSSKTAHCNQPVDIRNNGEAFALLGKQVYSLSFSQEGCFFSKYMFVIDTPRSLSSFGFVGVDVFVPSAKKIQNIKELLDALLDDYATSYIKENYMNKKETASLPEDFSFADNLISINKYAESDRLVAESSFASGLANSSYLIYHSSDELKDILNEPYRSEYKDYKKVFLIDSDLKNQGVLDVIKCDNNSDLTGKVDLKNLLYRIVESKTSKCNKNILHRNDNLSVTWSEKYCESKTEEGRLEDLLSKKVIELDEATRVVKVLDKSLNKTTKSIVVSVVDHEGTQIKNVSIFYGARYNGEKKKVSGNMITLEGEDTERIGDFRVYVEGLGSEYKCEKEYSLEYPKTQIYVSREKEVSPSFVIPKIIFENKDLDNPLKVDVSVKIGDDKEYSYNTKCRIDRLEKPIELKRSGVTIPIKGDNKENDEDEGSKKKKNVDPKLLVAILAGLLLSVGTFFLADYLDLNIFGSHNGHGQTGVNGPIRPDGTSIAPQDSTSIAPPEAKPESKPEAKPESQPEAKPESQPTTNTSSDAKKSSNAGTDLSTLLGKSVLECRQIDLKKDKVKSNSSAKLLLGLWNIDTDYEMSLFLSKISNYDDLKAVYDELDKITVVTFPKNVLGKDTKSIKELIKKMHE